MDPVPRITLPASPSPAPSSPEAPPGPMLDYRPGYNQTVLKSELGRLLFRDGWRGARELAHALGANLHAFLAYRRPAATFRFDGEELHYFAEPGVFSGAGPHRFEPYRLLNTWSKMASERPVEVAVAARFLAAPPAPARLLEVGNVMGNYVRLPDHTVLDKYELAAGVVNEDILEFAPKERYDRIVSVSTLEHVGYDEPQVDLTKSERAFARLLELLTPEGRLLVTVPVGYHPALDDFLAHRAPERFDVAYLANHPPSLGWTEVPQGTPVKSERRLAIVRYPKR